MEAVVKCGSINMQLMVALSPTFEHLLKPRLVLLGEMKSSPTIPVKSSTIITHVVGWQPSIVFYYISGKIHKFH